MAKASVKKTLPSILAAKAEADRRLAKKFAAQQKIIDLQNTRITELSETLEKWTKTMEEVSLLMAKEIEKYEDITKKISEVVSSNSGRLVLLEDGRKEDIIKFKDFGNDVSKVFTAINQSMNEMESVLLTQGKSIVDVEELVQKNADMIRYVERRHCGEDVFDGGYQGGT